MKNKDLKLSILGGRNVVVLKQPEKIITAKNHGYAHTDTDIKIPMVIHTSLTVPYKYYIYIKNCDYIEAIRMAIICHLSTYTFYENIVLCNARNTS